MSISEFLNLPEARYGIYTPLEQFSLSGSVKELKKEFTDEYTHIIVN